MLFFCTAPQTVVSGTGCFLSNIQAEDKDQSETGVGGTFFFLSWLTQNRRKELQDNPATFGVLNREFGTPKTECLFLFIF